VTASLASGTGTLTSATATTSATGVAAFNSLAITGVPGTYALAFSSPGLAAATSATIALGAGAASQLAFVAAPPTTATNGQPFTVTVGLRDAAGNAVSQAGVAVTVSLASGAGVLSGPPLTASTDAAGVASFAGLVITGLPGPYTLAFAAAGMSTLTSGTIQLAAGSPTQLILTVAPPTNAVSGLALVPGPAVRLADVSGSFVSTAGVQVTATLATGTGTLAGATATTDAMGTATFPALTISGPAGSYSLTFAAPGLTGVTTAPITVASGSPTQLTYTVAPPATAASGQPLNPQPILQVRDVSGNAVLQAGIQVTASAAGLTLTGESVTTDAGGVATFSSLTLSGAAGSYNLAFAAAGVANSISSSITLTGGGGAGGVTLTTQPSASARNDEAFATQPVVTVTDATGNPAPGVMVTASIVSGPSGTLGGTKAVATNASGVATFVDLEIVGPIGAYTLEFTAGGLTATSGAITLQVGVETHLFITQQPTNVALSTPISPAPTVEFRDSGNNRVPLDGRIVLVSKNGNGTFTLLSTLILLSSGGIAAFDNLAFSSSGQGNGNHTLTFSTLGLPSVMSVTFKVN
jgi:hypothetical protein